MPLYSYIDKISKRIGKPLSSSTSLKSNLAASSLELDISVQSLAYAPRYGN